MSDIAWLSEGIGVDGIERVTARMTADWLDTLSALADQGLADGARVSVFGMSMGARFGLPVAAAPGLLTAAAHAVTAPLLYHVQWDDALFPRDGQFELFEAFASVDKQLVARPGPHTETHPAAEASWQEFIGRNAAGHGERRGDEAP